MRISKIGFHNYRGFTDKEFELDNRVILFVGDNAKGKTTVLKGISLALSSWVTAFPEIQSVKFTAEDVRKVPSEDSEIPTFNPCSNSIVNCAVVTESKPIEWSKQYKNHSKKDSFRDAAKEALAKIEKHEQISLPFFGFYGTGRLWNTDKRIRAPRKENLLRKDSRYNAYQDCFESSSTDKILRLWVRKLSHAEFVEGKQSTVLKSVWDCIKCAIPHVDDAKWNPKSDDIVLYFDDGTKCESENLSEGQRIVMSLVADLCVRICLLNPHLNGEAIKQTDGVVLIDEVDLHLHPKWQKKLIPCLAELFPKLQFILTTHSPFVIQSMEGISDGRVISLDRDEPVTSRQTFNSVEDISENVMNVDIPQRSERFMAMKQAAKQYYALLKESKTSTSEEREKLKTRLDELSAPFSDNPAYVAFLEAKREAAGL